MLYFFSISSIFIILLTPISFTYLLNSKCNRYYYYIFLTINYSMYILI
nr:MAG TPA: hypothetical protein [Caudoviricetes sp.]